jgi:hypothetical protein
MINVRCMLLHFCCYFVLENTASSCLRGFCNFSTFCISCFASSIFYPEGGGNLDTSEVFLYDTVSQQLHPLHPFPRIGYLYTDRCENLTSSGLLVWVLKSSFQCPIQGSLIIRRRIQAISLILLVSCLIASAV